MKNQPRSKDFKEFEKIVIKYFPNASWNESTLKWEAKTKINPKDSWDQPEDLAKFDAEASKKFYSKMTGNSWDNEGNVTIGLRSIFEDYVLSYSDFLNEKKPASAPDWHDSDAPDAEGRFRDLGIKDLAAWLIKTRKKDVKKISGSLTQQIVFNRKEDPEYADKMEKVRKEVYKQLGREDLLESVDAEGEITCENCGWKWNISDGGEKPFMCHKCGHDNEELNEGAKIDLGGAEPLEIKELEGGISLVQKSKIGSGKNVIVIPKEYIGDLIDKLKKEM